MHRLPLSRNVSQPIPVNQPDVQQGRASSIKTCFLAIVLIIAPALGLATAALSDVVFPYFETPSAISEAAPHSQE
jgi:hypothetical protein